MIQVFRVVTTYCLLKNGKRFGGALPPSSKPISHNKLHLFNLTEHRLILIHIVLLHACYIFRHVLGHLQACKYKSFMKEDIK